MKLNANANEFIIPISQNEKSKVDSQKEIEELKKNHQKEIDKLKKVHLEEIENEKLRFKSLKHNQKILTNRLNEKIEKTISNCFLIESENYIELKEQNDLLKNNLDIQITNNKELRQHIIYLQRENNDFRLRLQKR